MIHAMSNEAVEAMQAALCGTYSLDINNGEARIVCAPLPGRALCAAAKAPDGVTWFVVDLDKPMAARHAWAMLREVRTEIFHEAVPEPVRGPCPLRLVS